ncbi:MAG: VWA domain-containing protein [Acidobacteriaceae bacterium]|nr:VWA domain-containing protein [Acidobacteriaceae bacterium]
MDVNIPARSKLALLGSLLCLTGSAQLSGYQAGNQTAYTIEDHVNLVLLDVSVKDPRGGYVTGLTKDKFQVFEDGRRQTITEFANIDTPVTVGLVVDNSGSMRFKRPEVVTAGLAFAKESNPRDEFFVVNFNNHVVSGLPEKVPFTDKIHQLRAALYYGEPMGQTALYDAIAYSLEHLELSRQDKRTLIVVSDGGDNVSKTSLPELMKLIDSSRATIYTVGLFDPDDRDRNPSVLRKLARVSGGEFFEPPALDDVVPVFHKISQDIRHRYSIGYVPDDVGTKRIVRSLRVVATDNDGRKLVVRTRTAYTTAPFSELISEQKRNTVEAGHNVATRHK